MGRVCMWTQKSKSQLFPTDRLAAQAEQLYAPNINQLTSVYEQVNLSKNVVQSQTF